MREDHAFLGGVEYGIPSPEEIERSVARARRMRSAAMHEYLARALAWARSALRPGRTPTDPAGQCC